LIAPNFHLPWVGQPTPSGRSGSFTWG
jgi:hypothetical protein